MSNASKTASAPAFGEHAVVAQDHAPRSAETKTSFKTTELVVFLVMALGIIITASVIGNGGGGGADHFDALQATQLLAVLTIGYMIARGIAKSGSRQPRD